jgi:hypothetical protein
MRYESSAPAKKRVKKAASAAGKRTGRSFTGGRSLPSPATHKPEWGRRGPPGGPGHRNILHDIDTLGEYTVGLGMVRPSHAPGNILEAVGIGAHGLPHDAPPPTGDLKHPSIEMIPWVPFGRGPRGKKPNFKSDLMDAATVEHQYSEGAQSIAAVAEKYGVDAKKLAKHIKKNGKKLDERIHGNEEHWKGKKVAPKMRRQYPEDMTPEVQASARKITAALSFGGAKKLRAEQEALWTAERGKRIAAAEEAMSSTPGIEGAVAARSQLGGELPRIEFQALKDKFGDKEVQDLFTYISNTDKLSGWKKVQTHEALTKVLRGEVPAPFERAALYKAFGPEFVKAIEGQRTLLAQMSNAGLEIANIPRSLLASFDVSAPFRQGLVAGAAHPMLFAKNFEPMMKSLGSERVYHEIIEEIYSRPNYELMQRGKLSITELGGKMAGREEQFPSSYAEIITGGKYSPVRASGRAYTGFLDKMRADMFDLLIEKAKAAGRNPEGDQHLLESIGTFINSATGRGDLGHFQGAATYLNTIFFSPRLLWSRLNFLNPIYYAKLDPFVRKEALKSMRNLVGTVGAFLFLAKMAGAHVNTDPRNADWAKIKIGNTRIDLLGGFQQPVRLFAQVASGKVISSATGDVLTVGPGFGQLNRRDIIQRFLEGKLAPTPSIINDWLKGTDFQGLPFDLKKELITKTIPLMVQDAFDLYRDRDSIPIAAAGYAVGSFGIGFQTYKPRDTFEKHKKELIADSKKYGFGQPPASVLEDLRWVTKLDQQLHGHAENSSGRLDYIKAVQIAAKLHDERFGGNLAPSYANLTSQAAAHHDYLILRREINQDYITWNRDLRHEEDARVEATG